MSTEKTAKDFLQSRQTPPLLVLIVWLDIRRVSITVNITVLLVIIGSSQILQVIHFYQRGHVLEVGFTFHLKHEKLLQWLLLLYNWKRKKEVITKRK